MRERKLQKTFIFFDAKAKIATSESCLQKFPIESRIVASKQDRIFSTTTYPFEKSFDGLRFRRDRHVIQPITAIHFQSLFLNLHREWRTAFDFELTAFTRTCQPMSANFDNTSPLRTS